MVREGSPSTSRTTARWSYVRERREVCWFSVLSLKHTSIISCSSPTHSPACRPPWLPPRLDGGGAARRAPSALPAARLACTVHPLVGWSGGWEARCGLCACAAERRQTTENRKLCAKQASQKKQRARAGTTRGRALPHRSTPHTIHHDGHGRLPRPRPWRARRLPRRRRRAERVVLSAAAAAAAAAAACLRWRRGRRTRRAWTRQRDVGGAR